MLLRKRTKTVICVALIAVLAIPQSVWAAAPSFRLGTPTKSQATVYIKKGSTVKLTARYIKSGDKVRDYKSSNKRVATVSKKGTVKGKKTGSATITVRTKKGKKDTVKIKVIKKNIKPKKIRIASKKTMTLGTYSRLSVSSSPTKITSKLSWKSSNSKIVAINSSGYMSAKRPGTATITVKAGKRKDTCKVTVKDPVKISKTSHTQRLDKGAFALKASAPSGKIIWSSSNNAIAKVSSGGKVTPVTYGAVTITAKSAYNYKATCKVNVVKHVPATKITMSPASKTAAKKKTYTLKAKLTSSDSKIPSNDDVTWKSSNSKIVAVNNNGQITAKARGTATIWATAESLSDSPAKCTVTVITIKTKSPKVTLLKGTKMTLKNTTYGLSSGVKIKWSSNKTSIATVNSSGIVTGKKAGTAVITATSPDGDSTKSTITVEDNPVIVDVSKWQGNIDWTTASKYVDLAILRVQYGTNATIEPKYTRNSTECKKYGVPFGAYSYALYKTKAQAEKEATLLYQRATAGGKKPAFLVVDAEESYITRTNTRAYIKKLRALAKKDGINRLKVGVYVGHHLYKKLNLDLTRDTSDSATPDFVWIPRYGTKNDGDLSASVKPAYSCDLWQYSSGGSVAGMSGRIDMNTLYDANSKKISSKSWFNINWLSTPAT